MRRLIEYNGMSFKVSEDEWERLLSMFDAHKATTNIFGYNCIHVNNICVDRSHKCTRCSLGNVTKRTNGCVHIFTEMIGKELCENVYLFDHTVMWSPRFDSEAREALHKVRYILSKAAIIE